MSTQPCRSERDPVTPDLMAKRHAAVLILAHNESGVIGATVASVYAALGEGDVLYVIADNCQDDTASQARQAGATVLERQTGSASSKGAALKWFIQQSQGGLQAFDLLVILDADNRLPPDFLQKTREVAPAGKVLQCLVQPVDYAGSPLSSLIALSELHEQRTMDALRSRLGWSVRLRGTGMLLPPTLLEQVADEIDTEVEDFALSLLFVARKVPIGRENRLQVYDAKPRQVRMAARQRARWYRGQWTAFWRYRREIGSLFFRGPTGWALLDALFFKPRWLVDFLCLLLGVALLPFIWPLAVLFLARPVFDLLCLCWTLTTSPERSIFLRAIWHVPGFVLMWLRGMFLAVRRSDWLRGRD